METQTVEIKDLIQEAKTYPAWTTGRVYPLFVEDTAKDKVRVYYEISGPVRRRIERIFPKTLKLSPRFIWVLGFLKGEGSNSLGKSNYRRFTITNTNPNFLRIVLEELEGLNLFKKENLTKTGVNVLHAKESEQLVRMFWANELNLPFEKIRYYDDRIKTSPYGVCHIYISDVLLRRVMDEVSSYVMKK